MRAALLLVAALLASAALQRPARVDGARALSPLQDTHEPRLAVVRTSLPTLAGAISQPGDGTQVARGTHPLAARVSGPTDAAPRGIAAAIAGSGDTYAPRRAALPSPRAPPLG